MELGLIHFTLAFYATDRPCEPSIGLWGYDHTDFEDANLQLQQRHCYCYERVVCVESKRFPNLDQGSPYPQAFSDDPGLHLESNPDTFEVPGEEDSHLNESDPEKLQKNEPPQRVIGTAVTNAKSNSTSRANYQRKQPSVPPKKQPVQPLRSQDASTSNTEVVKSPQTRAVAQTKRIHETHETPPAKKKTTSTKRKPKPPLVSSTLDS